MIKLERLNNRPATTVAKAIGALLKGHMVRVRSITADNGKEFAAHVALAKKSTPRFSLLIDPAPGSVEGWKMPLAWCALSSRKELTCGTILITGLDKLKTISIHGRSNYMIGDRDLMYASTIGVALSSLIRELTEKLFALSGRHLANQGLLWSTGSIVAASIIAAPSSTKNLKQERDQEMKQTKKGKPWYFGMKMHIDTDTEGAARTAVVTDAAVHDGHVMKKLLPGKECIVYGDQAYASQSRKEKLEQPERPVGSIAREVPGGS